ncbi:hypothetical protein MAP00_004980 [Monascus purpureus]|nr:hypothetical protein MAP00_004980 [Monascus purpureus]
MIPYMIMNFVNLFSESGWNMLIRTAQFHRNRQSDQAQAQFDGKYEFPENVLFRVKRGGHEWMDDMPWTDNTEEFKVCGATVRFVHLKPAIDGGSGEVKKSILFLHGNPTWSQIWRRILPSLVRQGHEVYALDWLGHGRSDKIMQRSAISFELHMRTLMAFFEHTGLKNAIVVAHDWGGCIALCTIPYMSASTCDGILLLDSFFPLFLEEVGVSTLLLSLLWIFSTGTIDKHLSGLTITRITSPHESLLDVQGCNAPYWALPPGTKSSVYAFSRLSPLTPRYSFKFIRETGLWNLLVGFLGPDNFNDLMAQVRMTTKSEEGRLFWKGRRPDKLNQGTEGGFKVAVVFGGKDPTSSDCGSVLTSTINKTYMVDWAPDGWCIKGSGRYPMEDMPEETIHLIQRFAAG